MKGCGRGLSEGGDSKRYGSLDYLIYIPEVHPMSLLKSHKFNVGDSHAYLTREDDVKIHCVHAYPVFVQVADCTSDAGIGNRPTVQPFKVRIH